MSLFLNTYSLLMRLLPLVDRIRIVISLCLILISGFFEFLVVNQLGPLLELLTSSTRSNLDPYSDYLSSELLGLTPIVRSSIFFALTALLSGVVKIFTLQACRRVSASIGSQLASIVFDRTLCQDYQSFMRVNSSVVIDIITLQIRQYINSINSFLHLLSASLLSVMVILAALINSFWLTTGAVALFSLFYIYVGRLAKTRLLSNSAIISELGSTNIQVLQEALGSFRDIVASGSQVLFSRIFSRSTVRIRDAEADSAVVSTVPKYIIDTAALIFVSLYIITSVQTGTNESPVIPTLGTLAFAMQRLLPCYQQIFSSLSEIASCRESIVLTNSYILDVSERVRTERKAITIHNSIELRNISFSYDPTNYKPVLRDISFKLKMGQRIGIIGASGSGKSTLIDIIIGLLSPNSGSVLIDNVEIDESLNPSTIWYSSFALVPQNIYLQDASLYENIAFGVDKDKIDQERVRECAKICMIDSYIESLPYSFNTNVGERGLFLSGGQRQRIGLARALYYNRNIIILDESTSALDEATESAVLSNIIRNVADITLLIITHRQSTLLFCPEVYNLSNSHLTLCD